MVDGVPDTESAILDAALAEVLTHGIRRTTASDIARRCGIARQTLYRYWPDAQSVFAALVTRELLAALPPLPGATAGLDALVEAVVEAADRMRRMPLVDRLRDTDPELFARYILDRLGTSQRAIHAELARAITTGRAADGFGEGRATHGAGRDGAAHRAVRGAVCAARGGVAAGRPVAGRALPRPSRLPGGATPMTVRIVGRTPHPSALSARRRARELDALAADPVVDVLVIGGGATGAGIALDAASRGLQSFWWSAGTSPTARAGGVRSSSTAGCGTWHRARSPSPTRARRSGPCS